MADALASGASDRKIVQVQVLFPAPDKKGNCELPFLVDNFIHCVRLSIHFLYWRDIITFLVLTCYLWS